jgi:Mrp family chromosome partitioning ATPase
VQATKVPNLFLLPRGDTTHRASELFLSPLTLRFLQEAAGGYDFVILDSAPVMAADDVTSLAPHIDGVIFVLRAEHTSARVARAALDLLYLRHVRILGLVFNAVRPSSVDYYYYYKYKDYHTSYPAA